MQNIIWKSSHLSPLYLSETTFPPAPPLHLTASACTDLPWFLQEHWKEPAYQAESFYLPTSGLPCWLVSEHEDTTWLYAHSALSVAVAAALSHMHQCSFTRVKASEGDSGEGCSEERGHSWQGRGRTDSSGQDYPVSYFCQAFLGQERKKILWQERMLWAHKFNHDFWSPVALLICALTTFPGSLLPGHFQRLVKWSSNLQSQEIQKAVKGWCQMEEFNG